MTQPRAVFLKKRVIALLLLAAAWSGCRPQAPERPGPPLPTPTPEPRPLATPVPYVPSRKVDIGKVFNGMQYRVTLETDFGTTATAESNDPGSYRADLVFRVKVPKAHQSLVEIMKLNPELPKVLPSLSALLEGAKISPAFDDLYRIKCANLQAGLNRFEGLLSKHNFYDCETILELQSPQTKRRAILIQSDMDVDTDGSDVDRVPEVEGASSTYQFSTSYRWAKTTETVSPLLAPRETRLKQVEQELASGPPQARKEQLRSIQTDLKNEIADLKKYRFLVAQVDPFIVLPGAMFLKAHGGFAPAVGDYCVVIHGRMLFPAIVGDAGPSHLMGEASLRICKEILPGANGAFRPVTELKATYLVFPGTAEHPFTAPNLTRWTAKCAALLAEIGGQQGIFWQWEDLTKPRATPQPVAAATPKPIPPQSTPPGSPAPALTPVPTPAARQAGAMRP